MSYIEICDNCDEIISYCMCDDAHDNSRADSSTEERPMMMISGECGQRMVDAENAMLLTDVMRGIDPDDPTAQERFERCRQEFFDAALAVVNELHRDGFLPSHEGD